MANNGVIVKILGDDNSFKKSLSSIENTARKGLGITAKGVAAVSAAFAGATVAALKFSGELEQNIGGAESVFKELGESIEQMAAPLQTYNSELGKIEASTSTLAQVSQQAFSKMGLSQSDYLATVNKMGALFKGTGFETQEALNMSAKAMQRAADVASIMGIDVSMAMESVAGAAKGNFTIKSIVGNNSDVIVFVGERYQRCAA